MRSLSSLTQSGNHRKEMKNQSSGAIKILVSACLVGERVRYDGNLVQYSNTILDDWQQAGYIVARCPEVLAGLPVPRPPSEITGGGGGRAVIAGSAKVISRDGLDFSGYFADGAKRVLELALSLGVRLALMKDGSPSCASSYIYDGSFSGVRKPGKGVTAALLEAEGIRVFSERRISEAASYLRHLT